MLAQSGVRCSERGIGLGLCCGGMEIQCRMAVPRGYRVGVPLLRQRGGIRVSFSNVSPPSAPPRPRSPARPALPVRAI